jgi:Brp/Blh family beta-carotene 15,15'-monooxygenase
MQKSSILLSFLGLWLTSYLSYNYQNILGLGLIFTFGILHGANDLLILKKIEPKKSKFLKIISIYLSIVMLSILLFYKIPLIILITFIIVSAYHFGEQNWNFIFLNKKSIINNFFMLNYGFLILIAIFQIHDFEVQKIILKITKYKIAENIFLNLFILSIIIYILLSIFFYLKNITFKKNIFKQTFYILVLFIIFKVSSLIWAFTVYFVFWHSIPSLKDQIVFLYGSSNYFNLKKYLKSAFIYWFISIIGISIIYYFSVDQIVFLALFFSLLASITFPHFVVILIMYSKEKD